jgi:hypothetical protein
MTSNTLANSPQRPRAAVWRVPNIRPATRRGGHAHSNCRATLPSRPRAGLGVRGWGINGAL